MVTAPAAVGVSVAVYVVPDPAKLLSAPLETVTSETSKSVVFSEMVNVRLIVESDEEPPSETSEAVIDTLGALSSADTVHWNPSALEVSPA